MTSIMFLLLRINVDTCNSLKGEKPTGSRVLKVKSTRLVQRDSQIPCQRFNHERASLMGGLDHHAQLTCCQMLFDLLKTIPLLCLLLLPSHPMMDANFELLRHSRYCTRGFNMLSL